MKKIFHKSYFRVVILALLFSMGSCADLIDLEPTHLATGNNAFRNLSDVERHLNGVYSYFRGTGYYNRAHGVLADMMTDNLAETGESLGNFRDLVDWAYAANDGEIQNIWLTGYATIKDVNLMLGNIDRLRSEDPAKASRLEGQGLAIRGLVHFDLLRYFAPSYDRNSTALGVPIRLVANLDRPARNTVSQVYDQIFQDLSTAKTLLSGSLDSPINTASRRTKIDAIVVDAITARAALYAGDYPLAITSATNVINSSLDLATRANFPTIWTNDAVANEVIWSVAYLPGQGDVGGNVTFGLNNRVSFKPSNDLISIYDVNNDIRYSSYMSDEAPLAGREGQIIVTKYLGRQGATDGLVDWKAFRVGEMYLIRAEARAVSGTDGGDVAALSDYNALRGARISDYVNENLAGAALRNAIQLERRRELFCEGHRWFDLKRLGLGISRGGDCLAPATNCSIEAGNFRWTFPIPQNELDANPNMAGQQNPGYN